MARRRRRSDRLSVRARKALASGKLDTSLPAESVTSALAEECRERFWTSDHADQLEEAGGRFPLTRRLAEALGWPTAAAPLEADGS